MKLKITAADRDFILALYESKEFKNSHQPQAEEIRLGEPTRIAGAFESWYELAASIGLIGIPVGVLVNLFSTWIWETYLKKGEPDITIKITLDGGQPVEIQLNNVKNLEELEERLHLLYLDEDSK